MKRHSSKQKETLSTRIGRLENAVKALTKAIEDLKPKPIVLRGFGSFEHEKEQLKKLFEKHGKV